MNWETDDLDPGPLPLWFQIADRLRAAIARGEFQPGAALPSEARLNERFGVSRTTARASLDRLEQEGLISRRSGKGSIVLSPRVEQPLNILASFSEDMLRRGLKPSYATRSADHARATAEVAEALGVDTATRVFRIVRLLKADDRPMGLSESWIAPAVLGAHAPPGIGDLDGGSLYAWLDRRQDGRIVGGHEFIEAAVATRSQAQSLGISAGEPLLVARRRSHAADGSPVEYAVMHYRADRYRFRVDLVRK
ncbi:GntR family transcriptional regulator [Labrys wisconsinensis]|uniref:GntR family transcriptional regulator n=1 Tax=Labrys wisconsinensis TaxID=425677 RepID=A0ABU0J311_9HYPH|nr:GntR family transcriptional regulator [Labrys wisconsinensis]MDQ0468619.1 GntR family transcriptional regulator [Labrys wisconsinensis]